MGVSAPFYLYTRELLNLPMASGGHAHSPDEYLVIESNDRVAGLVEAEKSSVHILYVYAEGGKP
jgi:hypothetical protein